MNVSYKCDLQVVNVTKIRHFEGRGKQTEGPSKPQTGTISEGKQTWASMQI